MMANAATAATANSLRPRRWREGSVIVGAETRAIVTRPALPPRATPSAAPAVDRHYGPAINAASSETTPVVVQTAIVTRRVTTTVPPATPVRDKSLAATLTTAA